MRFALWLLADPPIGAGPTRAPVPQTPRVGRELRRRRRLAVALRRLAAAQPARRGITHRVRPSRHVSAARPELLRLARALESGRPVAAAGIAKARELVTDASGPLYKAAGPEEIRMRVLATLAALDPDAPARPPKTREGEQQPVPKRRRSLASGHAIATVAAILVVLAAGLFVTSRAGAYVYWANANAYTLGRANVDGLGANSRFVSSAGVPRDIAIDEKHIYWVNIDGPSIGRANLDGTDSDSRFLPVDHAVFGIAVDDDYIYWSRANTGTIGRATLDGTVVDPNFITGLGSALAIAVHGEHLYWSSAANGAIGRARLNGTEVQRSLISGLSEPRGIAVDSGHIYWASLGTNSIGRANLDGSGAGASFIAGTPSPLDVAIDDRFVYWTQVGTNSIGRANLDGSGAATLIGGLHFPVGLAVDGRSPGHAVPSVEGLEYGSVPVGGTAAAQEVSIGNDGTGDLRIGQLRVGGSGSVEFPISADECSGATLEPATSCTVRVGFAPTATGPRSAMLEIPTDSPSGWASVDLHGVGDPALVGRVIPSAGELQFGSVAVGSGATPQALTVRNDGTGGLTIGRLGIADAAAAEFPLSQDGCSGTELEPGAECTVRVGFAPATAGARSGRLEIPTDAPERSTSVRVAGTGTATSTTALSTAITKGPKRKVRTDRERAKVKFKFTAGPAAAGYQCRLDHKAWKACDSPTRIKARRGRHTFAVRAVDRTGLVGPVTTRKFRVSKRR